MATNQGFKSFVCGGSVWPEYLRYYLIHSREYLESLASGTTFKELSGARTEEIDIPLPPLTEQRRIVAKLDELLARSRRAKEELASIPALLERYRQSVLAAAFRGDLTADWRAKNPNVEPASELMSRVWKSRALRAQVGGDAKPRSGTLGPSSSNPENRVSALPGGWCWVRWDDLADWITYGFTRPMPHVSSGVPIVTARHVNESKVDFDSVHFTTQESFDELSDKDRPRRGEILITKDGSIGRAAVVDTDAPFCINQSVAVVRFGGLSARPDYLLRVIEGPATQALIEEGAKGTAIKHIAITAFGRFPVPLAPLDEQREIVRHIDAAFARIDAVRAIVDEQLAQLDATDRSILTRAFRGELVPQDPNDEPASVLLDRIRAERAAAPVKKKAGRQPRRDA
jgi:type I restriction enzyme S subunit